MIPSNLAGDIDSLIRRAHGQWLQAACAVLGAVPESMDAGSLIAGLPPTNNSDAAHSLSIIIRQAAGMLTWRALGSSIEVCSFVFNRWSREQHIELLWTGPSPASQIPARRIDQVLYDLIGASKREILLVTFAAHKISRLTDGLVTAIDRGVSVRLILEFEEASAGQLLHGMCAEGFPGGALPASQNLLLAPGKKRKERFRPPRQASREGRGN